MKIRRFAQLIILACIASSCFQSGEALRGAKRNLQEEDQVYHFTPSHFDGCMQAQGKATKSDAVLTVDTPFCTTFTIDNNGLIRAQGESNLCLQAGHGKMLQDGSKMRLYPCDRSSIFQKFAWSGGKGRLKLKSINYDDLCVTFRGDNADYSDPIIFKKCHAIPSTHIEWMAIKMSAETSLAQ